MWLAGYYDDFNGARAIADFKSSPTDTTYTALASHYGNPLNGEAFLNPRYRWSAEERQQDSAIASGSNKIATSSNQYLQNDGIFEWLTFDDTRLSRDDWEGRVQLQYPDGHVANRYIFNNDSSDFPEGYQRFINGHNSDASYIVPTGVNDASFGRSDMKRYDTTNYQANPSDAGKTSTTGDFVQRAHLTGVWMGEQLAHTSSTTPSQVFAEVTSPSGQPFLCVQTVRKHIDNDSASVPAIVYDGPLNTRIDGDTFTARIAVRGFTATTLATWDDMTVRFEIGFPIAQAGICNDDGYTGTAAIDFTLDLADISYDTQGLLYSGSSAQSYTNDNSWIDVDFVLNYSGNRFKVYHNGTEITSTNATAGSYSQGYTLSATASNLYGYQISVGSDETDGEYGYVSYLMLDRVGLVRYLTDAKGFYTNTDEVQIRSVGLTQGVNGISQCNVEITDDPALSSNARGKAATDYLLNIRNLLVASSPLNWNLLLFGDTTGRIDRPIWRGEIDTFTIKQKARSRILTMGCKDSLVVLDRQIPLWDIGQKGKNDDEVPADYWDFDAQGFRNSMYLGAGKLKLLRGDVGFDSDSSYIESSTQRTQLGSGHPIQMYNNEDPIFGPNNIEDNYEGSGILGFMEKADTSTQLTQVLMKDSSHGIIGGDNVTIVNSDNHNVTNASVHSVSGASVFFLPAQLAYTPESAKIVFMGRYPGLDTTWYDNLMSEAAGERGATSLANRAWAQFDADHPSSTAGTNNNSDDWDEPGPHYLYVYFDADPGLRSGDFFYINNTNIAGTGLLTSTYREVRHRVDNIRKIKSYFTVNNDNDLWIVKTRTTSVNLTGGEVAEGTHGTYATDSLLTGNARFDWSNDTGNTKDVYSTNASNIRHRANHARWMRDLPNSLWFKYHFGVVKKDETNTTFRTDLISSGSIAVGATKIQVSAAAYSDAPESGIAEIWTVPNVFGTGATNSEFKERFVYQGKVSSGGSNYLIGCKYINQKHNSSGSNLALRFEDTSTDYKHIWLLWSDMRNNNKANADGETRKKDFGLMYPIQENYDFDLLYVDQTDEDGNLDKFASLKMGDDIDVWNIDSTTDPITNIAFSKPADYSAGQAVTAITDSGGKVQISTGNTTGVVAGDFIHIVGSASHDGGHEVDSVVSNTSIKTKTTFASTTLDVSGAARYYPTTGSEEDLAKFHDWEDKAGALVVVDTSPFFNLNTNTNGAKVGQSSGGKTDLGDFVVESAGVPTLVDNYWAEATASYRTTGDITTEHPAQYRLISDVTLATDGFVNNYTGMPVNDATIFDDVGAGLLIARKNKEVFKYYFTWESKLESVVTADIDALNSASTYQGVTVRQIEDTDASQDFVGSGVREGMVVERIPSAGTTTVHTIINVGDSSGSDRQGKLLIEEATVDGTAVTWASTDSLSIPIQLGKIFVIPADQITEQSVTSLTSIEDEVWAKHGSAGAGWTKYGFTGTLPDDIEVFEVHATVASNNMLRLLMHIDGYIESKNGGTFAHSDKMRMLWNAAIMDTWLPSAKVGCIFDINNVPITNMMTTYNDTTSNDLYGSVVDSRGKTLMSTLQAMEDNSNYGSTNNLSTSFSFLIGRDNRIEFRPKYNSGLVLNRDNMKISSLVTNLSSQITNVRVYYNDNKSFVDFPATNLTDSTRWKIEERPKIKSSADALSIAQQTYNKSKNNPLRMTVEPILEGSVDHKLTESGRYGYIADPYIALRGTNNTVANATNWTYLGTGGALFPGMVNALNGNMSKDIDPIDTRFGLAKDETTSGDIPWRQNYYWYGSNSISHAVQIVHIPNGVPFVSDTTSNSLRIWVDLKASQTGTSIDEAEFTVHVADYAFANADRTASDPSNNTSSKNVKHSGYYEIDIPQSYSSSQGKIVFSFNAEYCRSLLRHRCGDPTQTSSGTASTYILNSSATNGNSIFPLGQRAYSEMGGGFRNQRVKWYCPRINITRDLSYVPSTFVSVTDLGLEMNAESMVIQKIKTTLSNNTDKVVLELERDESISAGGVVGYLFPKNTGSVQVGGSQGYSRGDHVVEIKEDTIVVGDNPPGTNTEPSKEVADSKEDAETAVTSTDLLNVHGLKKTTWGRVTGRMHLPTDILSGSGELRIPGQNRVAVTPSTMKGIEGMDVDIMATSGSSLISADGYTFAGKGLQGADTEVVSQNIVVETNFVVPSDILNNTISIDCLATHSPSSANGHKTAVLYVDVFREEDYTTTYSNTVNIISGCNSKFTVLLPSTVIANLVAGDNLIIKITRKPGTGNDDSDASSVAIRNLNIKMRRASAQTESYSEGFSTHSG